MRDKAETTKTYGASFARFIHSHLTPRIERMHGKENHAPKPLKKKLVCDVCNREDGAKSEWEGTIEVWNWGNEYDHGTICDECQETVNDSR